jgi:hypothetical protein
MGIIESFKGFGFDESLWLFTTISEMLLHLDARSVQASRLLAHWDTSAQFLAASADHLQAKGPLFWGRALGDGVLFSMEF